MEVLSEIKKKKKIAFLKMTTFNGYGWYGTTCSWYTTFNLFLLLLPYFCIMYHTIPCGSVARYLLLIIHYSLVVHYSSRINIKGYQKMRLMPRHHSCNQLLIDIGLAAITAQSHVSHPSSYLGHY